MIILSYEELNILKELDYLGFESPADDVYITAVNDTQVQVNDEAVYDCLDAFSKNPDKWNIPPEYKGAFHKMCLRNAFIIPTAKDFETLAKIKIEHATDEYMYIIDVGEIDKSVTNDAPAVCMHLFKNFDLRNRRLIYKDSTGNIDEIIHDFGVFIRFAPGHKGINLKINDKC